MMKNQQTKVDIQQNIDTIPKDYHFYKSLIPELTVEMFREHEFSIKEEFEYDPCDYLDEYDDD